MTNFISFLIAAASLSLMRKVASECCWRSTLLFALPKTEANCTKYGRSPTVLRFATVLHVGEEGYFDILEEKHCIVRVCNDAVDYRGTYCGKGPCNMFGCNCGGGCFSGDAKDAFKKLHNITAHWIPTPTDILERV